MQTFATPGPVAASTDFELPQVRSKAPLVIAAVAVIGVVIAAVVVLKGGEPKPVPLSPVTQSPAAVTPSPTTPSTSTTATSTATAAAAADTPSNATPQTTPGAGFAELFASGARDAEGSGAAASRFDPAVAKKAVAKVLAGGVGKCKEPGGPRGVATAVIAFESSGKVSTVTFSDPPFAGTSTASCLTSILKQASIPPFKGLPGTLSQPISVR